MRNYRYKLFAFLIVIPFIISRAQISSDIEFNPLYKKLFIGSEVGANWDVFDSDRPTLNFNARFTFEYSIFNWKAHSLGIKQFFGAGNLRSMSNDLEPVKFHSDQFNVGAGAMYSFKFSENLYPYTMIGATLFIVNNKKGSYMLNEVNLTLESGFKLFAASNIIVNINGAVNIGKNEVIDNILPGKQDDVSFAFNFGLSYGIVLFNFSDNNVIQNDLQNNYGGLSSIGPIIDSDDDGVSDIFDKCPNTPKFLKVDSSGCPFDADVDGVPDYLDECPDTPKELIVNSDGCPIDTDLDGVPDHLDHCPDTQIGIEVDENGCTIDDDLDGVPNYLDECPDTEKGVEVDSHGCKIEKIAEFKEIIRTIYFDSEKYKVTNSDYIAQLDELLTMMNENQNSFWKIAGHCDGFESSASEDQIALERAKYIKKYFVQKGIKHNRIQTIDMGSEYPVESNLTIAGRARNRRAVIIRIK